ncbi:MAG TPA: serine hydrolase domain-containing protein [Terriglobia bacterium]|nr:serine hydrolase domain-containing protein [Terriglobia bacterium]
MRHSKAFSIFVAVVFAASILGAVSITIRAQTNQQQSGARNRAPVSPLEVGFSSQRLERLDAAVQGVVDRKQLSGAVIALARHGKVVEFKSFGKKDMATGMPMTNDTIFRVFSMSKPITSTAMMILYEEGRWNPEDPIAKYIPEFAHLKVFAGYDRSGKMILEDPVHPPTMRELMTHTAGFTYGFFAHDPVDKMYLEQHVLESPSLQAMIDKLANIPLLYQPGTQWVYSLSVDIQGYLVQKLSGMPLADFMRERIFKPLGMKDTGFYVPSSQWSRLATLYGVSKDGALIPYSGPLNIDFSKPPSLPSGGGGLVSTASDYLRFAQMLLNGGELNGTRILAPATVKLMSSNHLHANLMTGQFGIGVQHIRPGFGYGYDMAVFTDPALADNPVGKGTFLWDGAAGTWFWVDPQYDIVFVGMIQRMGSIPAMPNMEVLSRATVYQALVNPDK